MIREEITQRFRDENSELPLRVISNTVLNSFLLVGDKDVCAKTRCIVDQDGETIETTENEEYWDLTDEIDNFYTIDDWPASGVTYNGKALKKTTMTELDMKSPTWRSRNSGTPSAWYRRGKWLYVDRPIDSNEYDIKVYAILISDDFDSNVMPFNQLQYLEPFHPILVRYLKWRAKEKIGKPKDALTARQEYFVAVEDMKKMLGGNIQGPIYFRPKTNL